MTMHPTKNLLAICFITLPLLVAGSLLQASEPYERSELRRFSVSPQDRLSLIAQSASVTVQPGENDELIVYLRMLARTKTRQEAEERFDQVDWQFQQNEDAVSLKIKEPQTRFFGLLGTKAPEITVSIECPEDFNLHIKTASGRQQAEGVSGNLRFVSSSGDILLKSLSGSVSADTASGNVRLEAVSGSFSTDTASGNVIAQSFAGIFNADTASGDVHGSGELTAFSVDTASGDITIRSAIPPRKNSTLDSASGDIALFLPQNSPVSLQINSLSGSVHNSFQPYQPDNPSQLSHNRPTLSLDSASGDIHLEPLQPDSSYRQSIRN